MTSFVTFIKVKTMGIILCRRSEPYSKHPAALKNSNNSGKILNQAHIISRQEFELSMSGNQGPVVVHAGKRRRRRRGTQYVIDAVDQIPVADSSRRRKRHADAATVLLKM